MQIHNWHIAVGGFLLWYLFTEIFGSTVVKSSCRADQKLLEIQNNFITSEENRIMLQAIKQSPMVGNLTEKMLESEPLVTGEVAKWADFTIDGLRRLCLATELRVMCEPFINKVKIERANAFILKVYVGFDADYGNAASYYKFTLPIQGAEPGPETLDRWHHWVPHQINILNLEVPEGMSGGHLQMFEDGNKEERGAEFIKPGGPAYVEETKLNQMFVVKGNQYYTFTDYSVEGKPVNETRRVSVILEQYRITNETFGEMVELDIKGPKPPNLKGAMVFGTALFACLGASIGVVSSLKEQYEKKVWPVVLKVCAGALMGGLFGYTVASFVGKGWLAIWEGIVNFSELVQVYYIISPEFTFWGTAAVVVSIGWAGLIFVARYVLEYSGDETAEEVTEMVSNFIAGESSVTVKKKAKEAKDRETKKPAEEKKAD